MDSTAFNYDSTVNTSNGSCYYNPGCTNPTAFNYDSTADYNDGSCIATVYGCMDSTACNYNSEANTSDACAYPVEYYDCNDVCLNDADGDGV